VSTGIESRAEPDYRSPAGHEKRMAIKSDRWIRQQALEHKMIEPFS